MVAAAEKKRYSAEEYLAMERDSLDKHEFFDGEIFAMAGASPEHNLLAGNLTTALNLAMGDRCRVYNSDQRLYIPATGSYTYADASLLCERAADLTSDTPPALKNPEAIFEVLSPSTENYDRGAKFENYRTIPTLTHYVLVAQNRIFIEHFVRQPGGWLLKEVRRGERLLLPCGEVPVDPLYRWVLSG